MLRISIVSIGILALALTFALGEFALFPHVAEAHLPAAKFSVWALMFAELLSAGFLYATVELANRRNVPYAMAFPSALKIYLLVSLLCVPAAVFLFESKTPILLIHACALFFVAIFVFGFLTANAVGEREDYERGRVKISGFREDFDDVLKLIAARDLPKSKKMAAKIADDLAYAQESVPASEKADEVLWQKIERAKEKLSETDVPADEDLLKSLDEIYSQIEKRERVIKQNR